MTELILTILFAVFAAVGIICYFIKSTRNVSYLLFAGAFLVLGISGTIHGEASAFAAYLLALIASRKFETRYDKR